MKTAVRYYSRGGSTRKLAEAIGRAVGVEAKTTDTPLTEKVDVLFLGSAVYAAGVDDKVKAFINGLDPAKVGKVVNFSTAALIPSTYGQVQKLLAEKKIPLDEKEFHCRGQFMFMHRGKPDAADLENCAKFAKEIVKG